MFIFPGGISLSDYGIANAALFDGTTGYLSRTFAGDDGDTWTLSLWMQKSEILTSGQYRQVFSVAGNDFFVFADLNELYLNGSVPVVWGAGPRFRDPTAFFHLCLSVSAGTPTIYINGVNVGFSGMTYSLINSAAAHYFGTSPTTPGIQLFYGAFAEINFVSNQALTPSDFAEFDLATGNWKAKKYTGTYGTNGFYLDFSNSGALGTDASGNGNNWTVNGTVTQVTSTPTNVKGPWLPLYLNSSTGLTFSDGNRKIARTGGSAGFYASAISYKVPAGGKYIQAFSFSAVGDTNLLLSSCPSNFAGLSSASSNQYAPTLNLFFDPSKYRTMDGSGSGVVSYNSLSAPQTADQLIVGIDVDAGMTWFGVWDNSAGQTYWLDDNSDLGRTTDEPGLGTNPTKTFTAGEEQLFWGAVQTSGTLSIVDEADYLGSIPAGFTYGMTTNNLPERSPKTPTSPQTGSFTGNANADGYFLDLGMVPDKSGTSTINGNTITWGTHADACATGVKLRTASASYNAAGSNTYSIAVSAYTGGSNVAEANAQGNP